MNLIPLYEELFKKPDHTTLEHSCPRSLPFSFLAVGQIGLRYIPVFVGWDVLCQVPHNACKYIYRAIQGFPKRSFMSVG